MVICTYDCLLIIYHLLDALMILHYSWISADMKQVYKTDVLSIKQKYDLSDNAWAKIKSISSSMKKKSRTTAGLMRKERIVKILFYESEIFLLNLNFFISALPVFKSFVLYFQQKVPLIHKLHEESLRKQNSLFVGGSNESLMGLMQKNGKKGIVDTFYSTVSYAYLTAGKYILSKFSLNKLLISLSSLDPNIRGLSTTYQLMKNWLSFYQP